MHIRGLDPNTGQEVDHLGCSVSWMPMLLIENSQQQRSTSSAVESFRNEVVKANQSNQQLYINAITHGVVPTRIAPLEQPINMLQESSEEEES